MSPDGARTPAWDGAMSSADAPVGDALPGTIDLAAIHRAYAANIDALKAINGVMRTVAGAASPGEAEE